MDDRTITDQTEARAEAKRLNATAPIPGMAWVAMTAAAMRGQFESRDDPVWTITLIPAAHAEIREIAERSGWEVRGVQID